jgi:Icc-related predicted phosphoesterase
VSKLTPVLKMALIGVLGALALVSLLSRQQITVYALDLTLSMQIFDRGYTVIDFPPLGSIRAQTHSLPLLFRISLNNINLQRLSELVGEEPGLLLEQIQITLRSQISRFLIRVLAISFVGGFASGFAFSRDLRKSLQAGLAGLLLFSVLIGAAVATYDETAFIAPEFEGVVEAAPWLMGVAEEALTAFEDLDKTMQVITSNLFTLFESLNFLRPLGTIDGDLKVLHVSDIHNNPIAISLIAQMVSSFGIDLVIDTGDITDYGTPIEAELTSAINDLGIPYLFIPGNHDSPAVINSFGQLENVHILLEDVLYLEDLDLQVAGIADPASVDSAMTVRSRNEYREYGHRLLALVAEQPRVPDIIAFHHVYIAEMLTDLPSVLLHGHSHRAGISSYGKAFLIDAGSTGGAGVRGLMTREEMPYSMIVLHFSRVADSWQPVAGDIIKVNNINAGFILERHLLMPLQVPQQESE